MESIQQKLGMLVFFIMLCFMTSTGFAKKPKKQVRLTRAEKASPIIGDQNLARAINNALGTIDPKAVVGIQVKSLKYGEMLYSKNAQRLLVPASTLKILTAESALLLLGPQYRFPTSFVTDSKIIKNGILYGNLYLVHSGDPTLTYNDLAELMTLLKSQQINQINGNVYIDSTAYDQQNYGPGWLWDDKRFCYAAPISASIINHNCLTFQMTPGKSRGHLASVVQNPNVFYSPIQNSVVTRETSARSCYIRLGLNGDNSLVVTGCLPKGRYQSVTTVIADVEKYNRSLVTNLFYRFGIKVNGQITSGEAANNLSVVAVHRSNPLTVLINTMLKKSDNIIAGSLFKKLGETYTRRPGSWENGGQAVKQILARQMGVDVNHMNVIDGSGLSQFNRVTPAQLMKVLDYAYHHDQTNGDFISALPIAGIDGTLKYRLYNVARKVRAKTGTMARSGVVALAGYAMSRDNEPIAFVIIVNGRAGFSWKYRAMEDKVVTALTRYER